MRGREEREKERWKKFFRRARERKEMKAKGEGKDDGRRERVIAEASVTTESLVEERKKTSWRG